MAAAVILAVVFLLTQFGNGEGRIAAADVPMEKREAYLIPGGDEPPVRILPLPANMTSNEVDTDDNTEFNSRKAEILEQYKELKEKKQEEKTTLLAEMKTLVKDRSNATSATRELYARKMERLSAEFDNDTESAAYRDQSKELRQEERDALKEINDKYVELRRKCTRKLRKVLRSLDNIGGQKKEELSALRAEYAIGESGKGNGQADGQGSGEGNEQKERKGKEEKEESEDEDEEQEEKKYEGEGEDK